MFWQALGNNVFVIVLSLALQIPFSLGLAVLLNGGSGPGVFRSCSSSRTCCRRRSPGSSSGCCSSRSVIESSLKSVGLEAFVQDWLGDSTLVMITLFVIITWKYFGFHMIIMLAGLQGIPKELEEAAYIDGANRRQAFRHITLPLLGPTIRVSVFLSVIGALQLFDMVWVMTGGGPVNASMTMAVNMFKTGFVKQQMGYGSALAVILFPLAPVVALLYQRFVLRATSTAHLHNG